MPNSAAGGLNSDIYISIQGGSKSVIRVYTKRADTLCGVTFLAISPEHELLQRKELFTDSVLCAVDELKGNPPLDTTSDVNNGPSRGLDFTFVSSHSNSMIPHSRYCSWSQCCSPADW